MCVCVCVYVCVLWRLISHVTWCVQNKLPELDMRDAAMLERLLCIPHRSRFVQGELPDEPYTYSADPHIKDRFVAWAPYFLLWLLDGLKRYHEVGFREIPASCLTFKDQLLASKDPVRAFLDEHICEGEPGAFVTVKSLYNDYQGRHGGNRKRKKEKGKYSDFRQDVERVLRIKIKERHTCVQDGKRIEAFSVVLGFKRAEGMDM